MKIDEAKNKFLTFCQIEKGLTSITIEDYRLDFLNYEKCFPEIKNVEDISIDDLSNFVIWTIQHHKADLIKKGTSNSHRLLLSF